MATNDKFRASFAKRIEKAKGKFELFVKKLVVSLDASIVEKSPVDTGRFRANWIIGNGSPIMQTFERFSDVSHQAQIMGIKVNGQTIYLTNSLPYASRLEYGYSKQAPAGMVRVTLAEANSMANSIGASLRLV